MSLQAAILGFLSLEPTSGYTLKQRFDGSIRSFWTATQSQIYRELHTLQREGLVSVEAVPGDGKPDRKIYALTPAGRDALARWLEEPLEPLVLRHPLLLKVVFAARLPPERLDAILAQYAEGIAARRADYVARLDAPEIFTLARSARERDIWHVAIEHGIAWCDMELAWIAQSRERLGRRQGGKKWTRKAR